MKETLFTVSVGYFSRRLSNTFRRSADNKSAPLFLNRGPIDEDPGRNDVLYCQFGNCPFRIKSGIRPCSKLAAGQVTALPLFGGEQLGRSLPLTLGAPLYTAFTSTRVVAALPVFGTLISRIPFLSVAVAFALSISDGKSMTRRRCSEHCS